MTTKPFLPQLNNLFQIELLYILGLYCERYGMYQVSWICSAIYNSEVLHGLSDHYALNYHGVFSPTAYHAALALIRGHTWGSPTQFTFSTLLAGNELDRLDSIRHISFQRSLGGRGVTLVNAIVVFCTDLWFHHCGNGWKISIIQLLIDPISSALLSICPCWIMSFFLLQPVRLAQ